jgi:cell wall assembly regulator SMI1
MTREEMKKGPWVAVLNDNDTYTGLTGCWIAMTDQDQVKALDEGAGVEDVSGPHYDMQALLE